MCTEQKMQFDSFENGFLPPPHTLKSSCPAKSNSLSVFTDSHLILDEHPVFRYTVGNSCKVPRMLSFRKQIDPAAALHIPPSNVY